MKFRIAALCLLIVSHFSTPSQAWSEGGHRVIALITYEKLSPDQRAQTLKILRRHPRFEEDFEGAMPAAVAQSPEADRHRWLFSQAAVWPDLVRDLPEPALSLYHRPAWHYIDLPVFLDEPSMLQLQPKIKTSQSWEWKDGSDPTRNNAAQTIDMAMKSLRSSSTSAEKKALMLCWLLHSTGDIHQPLHCVRLFSLHQFPDLKSGDLGGNGISVTGRNPLRPQTLHAVWDGLLGYGGSLNDLRARAMRLLLDPELNALSEKSLQITSIERWLEEGRNAAATDAYTAEIRNQLLGMSTSHLMPVTLPENYRQQAGTVAQQRASIAGHRLAAMLGAILK